MTGINQLVLLALCRKATVNGEATVKLDELARMVKTTTEDVRTSLRLAVKAGEIEIRENWVQRQGRTERGTNTYLFTVMKPKQGDGEEIEFDEVELPGIPPPPPPPPKEPAQRIMMTAEALAEIAADPLYHGLNVNDQAWKFKRWAEANKVDTTVRRFKVWLSKV